MSEETSTIDEKKNKKEFQIDIKGFGISTIKLIIGIAIFFIASGINLYLSKLAEANLLPTNINCYPYTNNKIEITDLKEGSNIFYHNADKSMKIHFDPTNINNSKEKYVLLDLLRKNKNQHFLTNYIISIFEHLFQFNYSAFNIYYNSLNTLPESLLILLSPFTSTFYSLILSFINFFYFIFIWFYCMGEFFKDLSAEKSKIPPPTMLGSPVSYFTNNFIGFLFVILFTIILFFVIGISPLLISTVIFSCILSMCSYRSSYLFPSTPTPEPSSSTPTIEMTSMKGGQEQNGKNSIWTVIKDLFLHYKTIIAPIFAIFFISNTFTYLGNTVGLVISIVTIISYLGFISIPFFNPVNLNNNKFTKNVEIKQADKNCIYNNNISESSTSIMGKILDYFKTPSSKMKGGSSNSNNIPVLNKEFLLKLKRSY